jgi:hypothetical protein
LVAHSDGDRILGFTMLGAEAGEVMSQSISLSSGEAAQHAQEMVNWSVVHGRAVSADRVTRRYKSRQNFTKSA